MRIEHYRRQANGQWLYSVADGMEAQTEITAIGSVLRLIEIYDRVEFSDSGDAAENSASSK
jgi:hypothetical protein